MPESRTVQVAGRVLPESLKTGLRPIYYHSTYIYYSGATRFGRNYYQYDIGDSRHRLYYTIDTFDTFANLIEDGIVMTEHIPEDVLCADGRVDALIDVGSHHGIYSVLLQKLNPDAQLYSFEPDDHNREILTEVLSENGIDAEIDHRVVSDETGSMTFYVDENQGSESHSIARSSGFTAIEKESVALSEFFVANGIEQAFVKIDAEGAELGILRDLFADPPEHLEGIVEFHPDKLSEPVEVGVRLFEDHCREVEFLADTSPTHPEAESIAHEYNRPMYYFVR